MATNFEQRANSGSLFRNGKTDNPKAPHYKGRAKVIIDDREIELDLAAWVRKSDKAGKYLSLSVKQKGLFQPAERANGAAQDDDDLDL